MNSPLFELFKGPDLVTLAHTRYSLDFATVLLSMPVEAYTSLVMQSGDQSGGQQLSFAAPLADRLRVLRDAFVKLKSSPMFISMPSSRVVIPSSSIILLMADDHLIGAVISMSPPVATTELTVTGINPFWSESVVKAAFLWAVDEPVTFESSLMHSAPGADEFFGLTDELQRIQLNLFPLMDFFYPRWESDPEGTLP